MPFKAYPVLQDLFTEVSSLPQWLLSPQPCCSSHVGPLAVPGPCQARSQLRNSMLDLPSAWELLPKWKDCFHSHLQANPHKTPTQWDVCCNQPLTSTPTLCSQDLWSPCPCFTSSVLSGTPWSTCYYYLHFTDEDTEEQTVSLPCLCPWIPEVWRDQKRPEFEARLSYSNSKHLITQLDCL